MQVAPITEVPVAVRAAAPEAGPAGWAPESVRYVRSAHGDTIVRGALAAWRGLGEPVEGQALSPLQVETLAPVLSEGLGVEAPAVRDALEGVRLHVGGAVVQAGAAAMVLADRVYVRDEAMLDRILSWGGRRLLAHELGHVVQRERISEGVASFYGRGDVELGRTRAALAGYVAGMAADPSLGPGAVPRGLARWLLDRLPGRDADGRRPLGSEIHDAHHMEIEVERVARAFRDATRGG